MIVGFATLSSSSPPSKMTMSVSSVLIAVVASLVVLSSSASSSSSSQSPPAAHAFSSYHTTASWANNLNQWTNCKTQQRQRDIFSNHGQTKSFSRHHKIIYNSAEKLLALRGGSLSASPSQLSPKTNSATQLAESKEQEQQQPSSSSLFQSTKFRKELIAELIGTYLIVMLGSGSVMSAVFTGSLVGLFQIASCWIISVTVAIYCTSKISGAHLNPAITVALATFREFEWKKVVPYSLAQLTGAMLGSLTSYVMYASTIKAFESANGIIRSSVETGIISAKVFGEYFASPVTTALALVSEAIGTGVLAFVVFSLTNPKNDAVDDKFIPVVIGLTVGALVSCIAPLTQAGFNPARDFGPRIIAWLAGWRAVAFKKAWVYILAPVVGALGGAFVSDRVLYADSE
mmetsp:Transcript_1929/g.4438  ORF Transcript_1929/g.4438 Transcript_1929/m.4438 type:complete len:402 (-) Transcript_1929:1044-2249(-)